MTRAQNPTHRGELVRPSRSTHKLRQPVKHSEAETSGPFRAQPIQYKYPISTTHYIQIPEKVLRESITDIAHKMPRVEDDE